MELKTTQEDKTHKQSRNWVLTQSRKERREREREMKLGLRDLCDHVSERPSKRWWCFCQQSRFWKKGENVKKSTIQKKLFFFSFLFIKTSFVPIEYWKMLCRLAVEIKLLCISHSLQGVSSRDKIPGLGVARSLTVAKMKCSTFF